MKSNFTNQAGRLNGQYISAADVLAKGGEWNDEGACYVFADGSIGRFTDIRNGAAEQDAQGNAILHFVGGGIAPDHVAWGGARPGAGRHTLADDEPTIEGTISLPQSLDAKAKRLGDGNRSAGIRKALESFNV